MNIIGYSYTIAIFSFKPNLSAYFRKKRPLGKICGGILGEPLLEIIITTATAGRRLTAR